MQLLRGDVGGSGHRPGPWGATRLGDCIGPDIQAGWLAAMIKEQGLSKRTISYLFRSGTRRSSEEAGSWTAQQLEVTIGSGQRGSRTMYEVMK